LEWAFFICGAVAPLQQKIPQGLFAWL